MEPLTDIPDLHIKTIGDPDNPIYSFEGMIQLPVWAGFQSRQGVYGSMDSNHSSDGTIMLHLGSDRVDSQPVVLPGQVAAYQYLIANQTSIQNSILRTLLQQYPGLQAIYGHETEEGENLMPDVSDIAGFKNLVGLSTIHILELVKDGIAYVGYSFGCSWDDEHGLGVMMHRERIVDLGGVDTSFLTWIAEKDLNAASVNEPNETNSIPPLSSLHRSHQKRPWWKIW